VISSSLLAKQNQKNISKKWQAQLKNQSQSSSQQRFELISQKGLTIPNGTGYINKAVEGNSRTEPMKVAL
jgi:hypothetical protein